MQDFTIPLDSFIKDWEMHGFYNVSVFVPVDFNGYFTFSSYAVLIRNNDFGRRLLHYWLRFANGLCEKGNFNSTPGSYEWGDSDQPGLWYALTKTHAEFTGREFEAKCVGGKIVTKNFMEPEMNQYFRKYKVGLGSQGKELYDIPKGQCIALCFRIAKELSSVVYDRSIRLCIDSQLPTLLLFVNRYHNYRPTDSMVQNRSGHQGRSWSSKSLGRPGQPSLAARLCLSQKAGARRTVQSRRGNLPTGTRLLCILRHGGCLSNWVQQYL